MNTDGILDFAIRHLKMVRGIDVIVLGGSRATGTATRESDIDIGVYYNDGFDIAGFKKQAVLIDDEHRENIITDLGGWGPWINGGGWLKINGVAVDIIFRETAKVTYCIDDCCNGAVTIDFQCGHPFGFVNAIYMGEVFHCRILHENGDVLRRLKQRLAPFPVAYQQAAIARFLWECDFSLMCGKKAALKGDVVCVSGALFRSAVCLIYALYAANNMYFLNEKGSLDRLVTTKSAVFPVGFKESIERSLILKQGDMIQNIDDMTALYAAVCKQVRP